VSKIVSAAGAGSSTKPGNAVSQTRESLRDLAVTVGVLDFPLDPFLLNHTRAIAQASTWG
jgi:hypothetical protein